MTQLHTQQLIRSKVIELAGEIGHDARAVRNDQILPSTGFLDSAAIMALIAWYEVTFHLDIPSEDLTIDNFGSVDQMVDYVRRHAS